MGDDENSFALCRQIVQQNPEADVFLQCADVRPQSVTSPRLHLFSPEETAARLFWKERCLYSTSTERGHRLSIVLLGGGALAENLLYYGLLDNIFHPKQRIEYHIFGGCARFAAVHTQLDQIGDPALTLLAEAAGLEVFPWLDLALKPEHILQDDLFTLAKRINLRYAHIHGGVEEADQNREAEWDKLDAFTRYSNVSCADYHDIRLEMLKHMGLPADADRLPPDKMELLAELKHIRWCRYHYLNNWRRGAGEDGKKDPAARLHPDLVSYEELTGPDKKKDRDNIKVLLSVSH